MTDRQTHSAPRRDPRAYRGRILDIDSGHLAPGRVLVQGSPAGYVALGLGAGAALVDFAFARKAQDGESDPFLAACSHIAETIAAGGAVAARRLGMAPALGEIGEPGLRRLAVAEALSKAGFNPDEPRDWHGRWTAEGDGGEAADRRPPAPAEDARPRGAAAAALRNTGVAAAAAGEAGADSLFVATAPETLAGLAALAGRVLDGSPAAVLFNLLFFSRAIGDRHAGAVPGHADVRYRFEGDTGDLTFFRHGRPVYALHAEGGAFRTADGRTVGRVLGNGDVAIDAHALPPAIVGVAAGSRSRAATQAGAETRGSQDEPEICPAPETEPENGGSFRAKLYQSQISKLPIGLAVRLGGVVFDGCDERTGTMLEAKGPGYAWALQLGPEWFDRRYNGNHGIKAQMKRQSDAAGARRVEWHFAEKPVAEVFQEYLATEQDGGRLKNIVVIYTPPDPGYLPPKAAR